MAIPSSGAHRRLSGIVRIVRELRPVRSNTMPDQPLQDQQNQGPTLHVQPRYYSWVAAPGVEWTEKNTGYARLDWHLPLTQTALILLDVWEGMYLKDTAARNDHITRQVIVPLVAAARAGGMPVIHCPGQQYGKGHRNLLRYGEHIDQPSPQANNDWPPADFRTRKGSYATYAKPSAPQSRRAELDAVRARNRIHPAVEPAPGEPVILTGSELHEYCKRERLLFLFYAGFQTNACLFTRDYGAWEMHKRGYTVVVVRDAGTAMESFETADRFEQTRNAVLMLEMFEKYSVASQELRDALAPLER